MASKYLWLDVDPGHDDATAILLALHCQNIQLLGISTVHGNAPSYYTAINAARCLLAFGSKPGIKVYRGADKPLIVANRHDPEIHGPDGLGGVEGLPAPDDPRLRSCYATDDDGEPVSALEGMAKSIKQVWNKGAGKKVTVVSCGPMTNIAIFVAAYPDLLPAVEEFVFMGGGVGMGNRSAVAEFNIICDPHALQIVLDAPVRTVMIPINVSHIAIVTKAIHTQLLSPGTPEAETLPPATTNLRHTLSTLIGFFADSYKSTFGFNNGPPLHDALTIAYVSQPDLFTTIRKRVDVELAGAYTRGETVVDIWDYQKCDDTWGAGGKNCLVARSVDVDGFFDLLLTCVAISDSVSPLNA
ncbi:Inosine-uridine-preferring nucleoside hydrolase like protein, partial [Termitomyces sp. T112]